MGLHEIEVPSCKQIDKLGIINEGSSGFAQDLSGFDSDHLFGPPVHVHEMGSVIKDDNARGNGIQHCENKRHINGREREPPWWFITAESTGLTGRSVCIDTVPFSDT